MSMDKSKSHPHQKTLFEPDFPEFTIRASKRAKYVRFQISVKKGLVVVIPNGFDKKRIPGLIEENREWIEEALREAESKRRIAEIGIKEGLPEYIRLRAIGDFWMVEKEKTRSKKITVKEREPSSVILRGNVEDRELCLFGLRRWLAKKGQEVLVPWLEGLANNLELPIGKISIRGQKTRWGSCSSKKNISLNYKLLFLPNYLVRYVLIHELCHTLEMNHSDRYWREVEMRVPDYPQLERELTDAIRFVPLWVED